MDDRQIVELYHKRDERAITETGLKYGRLCHRIAMSILGVREDAEECVNDTWHTAWDRMPPHRPRSLAGFLGKIIRDLSISRYRANRAQKRYSGLEVMLSELDECVPAPNCVEQEADLRCLSEAISNWLDSLPGEDCALFVKRYWYGDSVAALASRCGCTPNQMAQRMLKLRGALKAALEQEGVFV